MDSALLKPHARFEITETTDATGRPVRNTQIFENVCQARGQLVVTEAALMMPNSLEGDNWLGHGGRHRFDTMKAFDEFTKVFDRDYQYDPEYGQRVLPHCCPRCAVSHVWTRFQAQFP